MAKISGGRPKPSALGAPPGCLSLEEQTAVLRALLGLGRPGCVRAQVLPGVTACVTFAFLSLEGFLIREKEMPIP